MAAAAAAVLDNSADLPQELLARAVAARIAGLILTDQAVPALRETSRYRGRLGNSENTQILFRFLLAQAEQGGRTQNARPAAK